MQSTIKQGYVAPMVAKEVVAAVTLGINTLAGEPSAGYHI
jgi:hypothetical protein